MIWTKSQKCNPEFEKMFSSYKVSFIVQGFEIRVRERRCYFATCFCCCRTLCPPGFHD